MKTNVLESFVDKNTGIGYNAGAVFDGDADRIAELAASGYVEPKEVSKRTTPRKTAK